MFVVVVVVEAVELVAGVSVFIVVAATAAAGVEVEEVPAKEVDDIFASVLKSMGCAECFGVTSPATIAAAPLKVVVCWP